MSSVPSFLKPEPKIDDRYILAFGNVSYDAASDEGPRVLLGEFVVPVKLEYAPQNPIQWRAPPDPDTNSRPQYSAFFRCGYLTIHTTVTWEAPGSRDQIAGQLDALRKELDQDCAQFEVGAPVVPTPQLDPSP